MGEKETQKRDPVLRVLLALARGLLVLGLLLYLLYHLTNGFSAEMRTETVRLSTEEILLETDGTIVRDERQVTADASGVVSYRFADGERVKAGAKIAMLYDGSADSADISRIAEIDRAIDLLLAANIDEKTNVSDGAAADHTIAAQMLTLSEQIARGEYTKTADGADALLTALVRRDTILADGGEAVGARLAALQSERAELAASLSLSQTVYAPEAGYFYADADGGEAVFDFNRIETLTPADYRLKMSAFSAPQESTVGKLVRSSKWYLLMPVTAEEALGLRVGNNYTVIFSAEGQRLTMRLAAKNEGGEEVLLVLTTHQMPVDFSFARTQKVALVRDTVEGYRLPASALRVVDDTVGVYIRSGNTIKFRAADVLYESGAYVYVDPATAGVTLYARDEDETNDLYCKGLSLYDTVIIGGAKDLTPEGIVK